MTAASSREERRTGSEPSAAGGGYTIASLDESMRQIMGAAGVRPGDPGWFRSTALLTAAQVAWTAQRPEDEHSERVRAAIRDLNAVGFLRPTDNIWPEDA